MLEYADADVALLLDCCYAASANQMSVAGTIEILAACCQGSTTIGISSWSFTSCLVEVLRQSVDKSFSLAMLHAKLVNYRGADGDKKLLRTPIYSIMADPPKPSIQLTPLKPESTPPLISDLLDLSEDSENSNSVSDLANSPPFTRVWISVSLRNRFQSADEWVGWLTTQMPPDVMRLGLIKTEGAWKSHSTMVLVTVPIPLWDLLPRTGPYGLVGYVTSPNLLEAGQAPKADKLSTVTQSSIPEDEVFIAVFGLYKHDVAKVVREFSRRETDISKNHHHYLESSNKSFILGGKKVHLFEAVTDFDRVHIRANELIPMSQKWLTKASRAVPYFNCIVYLMHTFQPSLTWQILNSVARLRYRLGSENTQIRFFVPKYEREKYLKDLQQVCDRDTLNRSQVLDLESLDKFISVKPLFEMLAVGTEGIPPEQGSKREKSKSDSLSSLTWSNRGKSSQSEMQSDVEGLDQISRRPIKKRMEGETGHSKARPIESKRRWDRGLPTRCPSTSSESETQSEIKEFDQISRRPRDKWMKRESGSLSENSMKSKQRRRRRLSVIDSGSSSESETRSEIQRFGPTSERLKGKGMERGSESSSKGSMKSKQRQRRRLPTRTSDSSSGSSNDRDSNENFRRLASVQIKMKMHGEESVGSSD